MKNLTLAPGLRLLRPDGRASVSSASLTRYIPTYNPQLILINIHSSRGARKLFTLIYESWDVPIAVLGDEYEEEIIWYLENGAWDFIPRSASSVLVAARIGAIFRRLGVDPSNGALLVGEIEIDTGTATG